MSKKAKNQMGSISQPPRVWGPSEGYEWAKTAYTGDKRKKHKRIKRDTISNPRFQIELDTIKHDVLPKTKIKEIIINKFGSKKIYEDFNIIKTVEIFVNALYRIKFKEVGEISFERKVVYSYKEKKKNVDEILKNIKTDKEKLIQSKFARITAKKESHDESQMVTIKIKKVHKKLNNIKKTEHPINIEFNGEIERKTILQFVNHLKNNLKIKNVIYYEVKM